MAGKKKTMAEEEKKKRQQHYSPSWGCGHHRNLLRPHTVKQRAGMTVGWRRASEEEEEEWVLEEQTKTKRDGSSKEDRRKDSEVRLIAMTGPGVLLKEEEEAEKQKVLHSSASLGQKEDRRWGEVEGRKKWLKTGEEKKKKEDEVDVVIEVEVHLKRRAAGAVEGLLADVRRE